MSEQRRTGESPVDEVLNELNYLTPDMKISENGYGRLKSDENRMFLRGMAYMYTEIRGMDVSLNDGTGSDALNGILDDIRKDTHKGILDDMMLAMEDALSAMLDDEAAQETED